MFRKYQQFWKKNSYSSAKSRRRGLFGGKILSMEKVNNISKKISSHEKAEQDSFDKAFAAELSKL